MLRNHTSVQVLWVDCLFAKAASEKYLIAVNDRATLVHTIATVHAIATDRGRLKHGVTESTETERCNLCALCDSVFRRENSNAHKSVCSRLTSRSIDRYPFHLQPAAGKFKCLVNPSLLGRLCDREVAGHAQRLEQLQMLNVHLFCK